MCQCSGQSISVDRGIAVEVAWDIELGPGHWRQATLASQLSLPKINVL